MTIPRPSVLVLVPPTTLALLGAGQPAGRPLSPVIHCRLRNANMRPTRTKQAHLFRSKTGKEARAVAAVISILANASISTIGHLSGRYQLIIVSGLPTSGKSTRAKQLHEYLTKRVVDSKYRLHLISDESLSISRAVYDLSPDKVPAHTRSANASEKDARATIYGAVKRVLSDKDIVILDGLNYIKGWRYQLHCESKAVRTPNCGGGMLELKKLLKKLPKMERIANNRSARKRTPRSRTTRATGTTSSSGTRSPTQ
ncbi:hypothetical protein G7Z17_g12892 [Cylindrodendrum hubeiense]|uniref:Uncharacterized protein n=1 Tax=Cylindrodendrum hubeiense TaxID=595255 RepID=A0A9P5LA54_9HYPO|nr:hypothetical protein G7Z17_g12892 [Cylindrodendrum hubeiense]